MRRLLAALGLCAALSTGCYTANDGYYYDYAYYDPYWYGYDAAYAYSWVDPYGAAYFYVVGGSSGATNTAIDVNGVAQGIANSAASGYTPAGCANASVSGATVTYNFVECTGSLGLASLNGPLTLTVSESDGLLVLTANSAGLLVAGNNVIIDSQTTVTTVGDTRTATIVSHTRAPDRVDSRDATFTVSWTKGENCFTVNGDDVSVRDSRTATTSITNYKRCTGQCPTTGTISVTSPENMFFAAFDGSNTVQVLDSTANERTFTLQCQ